MNSFLSDEEMREIGFSSVGSNVLISRKASIYGADCIRIGSNVRIDDFCILSGNISIGNHIHIDAYSALFGGSAGITLDDFSNISSRVCIYALSDDFSGTSMTNPMIPDEYKNIQNEPVYIGRHVVIGSGSTVLPGVKILDGSAVGAMSLCKSSIDGWEICAGIPARTIKERQKRVLELEKEYEKGGK